MGSAARKLVTACRVVHMACSMVAVPALLGMAASGILLVHQDSLETERTTREIKQTIAPEVASGGSRDEIVAALRKTLKDFGAVEAFEPEEDVGVRVVAADPRGITDVYVGTDGVVEGTYDRFRLVEVLGNLHRSKHTGGVWAGLIDVSAVCLALACLTGIVLWLGTPARRVLGLVALGIGVVAYTLGYLLLIP